jgi:phosphoribosylformimino-5-aminoimidazole carboxamide ribotide isomerase
VILLPAVDIRDGRAVRLRQGRFDEETVYADDPLEAARSFVEAGARQLHLVDLDGAREGRPVNLDHVTRIAGKLGVPVELGGGLRSFADLEAAVAAGAQRLVLGTAAFSDEQLLERALDAFGERVLVGVDVRGGHVSVSGWTRETELAGLDAIELMQERGVTGFVYTNVDRDGMLEGPDLDEIARVGAAVRGTFVYSGGIGSLADLVALRGLDLDNLVGVISGKALYEHRFGVAEGQAALDS